MVFGFGFFVLLALAVVRHANGDWISHTYQPKEKVVLWLNKIGPFHNPQETYLYYSLPFCRPTSGELAISENTMGEILEGNQLVDSGMQIQFSVDQPPKRICETDALSEEDANAFKYAVSQHYWYQCFVDELPIWAMVGEMDASLEELVEIEAHENSRREHQVHDVLVYTHRRLSIAYNGKAIIEVNLTSDLPVKIQPGVKLAFSYEVKWTETPTQFSERFNRYLDYSFFEHQIHWFSIFNSFMMVIFLCGLVALILIRTLNNDYLRFSRDELMESHGGGAVDESGWKQVNGDVFRAPPHLMLLSSLVGTGMQLVTLAILVVLLAIAGSLYVDRGAIVTVVLQNYCLTFVVNGYCSGRLFKRYETRKWIQTLAGTASIFPLLVVSTLLFLNLISIYNGAINLVSVGTIVMVILVWVLVCVPLTVLGTVLGRHTSGVDSNDFPCRVNALPRPIPARTWLNHPGTIVALTGVLPFGAVFIEIFFIFSSMWSQKFYYVYGFLLLVLGILVVVTLCVTVVAVYFQLNSEDWRWPWTSFLAASSTAVYVFLYGVYYFWFKTNMTGFLQTNYYFGYLALFSLALGLMCGAIGFLGTFYFVLTIFKNIKLD